RWEMLPAFSREAPAMDRGANFSSRRRVCVRRWWTSNDSAQPTRNPTMESQQLDGSKIFVVRGFFSRERCEQELARSEQLGYEDAPITTAAGFVMRKDIRNNARVMRDDPALAEELYQRAKPFLPQDWCGWNLVGFNERFRYYRYDRGQKFAPH